MNNSLKYLADLDYQERYKDGQFPEYARHRKRFSDKTANKLTQAIIHFLKLTGNHAERINTMGRPVDKTKTVSNTLGQRQRIGSIEWLPGSGQKGSADISATINGRSVKIEVKMKDRQSQAQREYQRQIEAAGGKYWVCRSFDQFIDKYKNLLLQDKNR